MKTYLRRYYVVRGENMEQVLVIYWSSSRVFCLLEED